jgi:hypothetical protein
LNATGWKDKQTGIQGIIEWIRGNTELATQNSEAIARHIKYKVKDWKENNFNVIKSAFEAF